MTRAVLVTGASTGIGHATVAALQSPEVVVYAGVRSESDAERLQAAGNVRPLLLDVTQPDAVTEAAARIRTGGVPLAAAVCSAGVAFGGPLEFMPLDRLRYQLEVNVIGALAVAQATLPMLRETKGRLIFIGSISAHITPPFMAPYATSKAALSALTDALRFELDSSASGVRVVLFEFGNVRTPIWQKGRDSLERHERDATAEERRFYAYAAPAVRASLGREVRDATDAGVIARAIARAAVGRAPRDRYLLGAGAKVGAFAAAVLPVRMRGRLLRKAMGLP